MPTQTCSRNQELTVRILWVQYPPGIIIPPDDDPTELQLRRLAEARDTLKRYADLFHSGARDR